MGLIPILLTFKFKIINKSQNVEYKLSEFGNSAIPIISALKKWSLGRKREISKIVQLTK